MSSEENAEIIGNVMEMKHMANLLMTMKQEHPAVYINRDRAEIRRIWQQDINDLSHIIRSYEVLISQLYELTLRQQETIDKIDKPE